MKTNLLKLTVLAVSLMGALTSASAETLHARIPFGFSAGGVAMPAGAYRIRPLPYAPSVLVFENEATKSQTIVFVRLAVSKPAEPAPPLMFITGGERAELAHIATAERTYELSVYPAPQSLKGAALTLASAGK